MGKDVIYGEILPDGSVKTTTGAISAENHDSAEDFLDSLARFTGGKVEITEDEQHSQFHTHHHDSDHQHQ